jgi:hypothetical protein
MHTHDIMRCGYARECLEMMPGHLAGTNEPDAQPAEITHAL